MTAAEWRELIATRPVRFPVVSSSMAPTLRPGDEVRLSPLQGEPEPGEIIAFLTPGGLVVHRYLGRGLFRGDRRLLPDPPVPRDLMIGRVASVHRGEFELRPGKKLGPQALAIRLGLNLRAFLARWLPIPATAPWRRGR